MTPPTLDSLILRARAAFQNEFACEPAAVAWAPGRVNLIGEHTDYNGGLVMPIAIDRWCAGVGAISGAGGEATVHAADVGETERIAHADLSPQRWKRSTWPKYVAGVLAGFARRTGTTLPGLRLALTSNVPMGAGLSSSAALEVCVATLLEQLLKPTPRLAPLDNALLCQHAEHEFAGVPCGIMDQFASTMGRAGHAMLIDCRSMRVEHVPLPPPDRAAIVVADSGVKHDLAASQYAARRAACESAARALGIAQLRDATSELIDARASALTEDQRRCAEHVLMENRRVLDFAAAVRSGDLVRAGELMFQSHTSLRDLYRVSCRELDALVAAARSVPGVFGSRLTGAGFGGCTITLCRPAAAAELINSLGVLATAGFAVRAVDGAGASAIA